MWDKLKNIYEGNEKVKKEKLQTYSGQLETIKMREEENIASYLLQLDEIINVMKGIGVQFFYKAVVQKGLKTLPPRFESKV